MGQQGGWKPDARDRSHRHPAAGEAQGTELHRLAPGRQASQLYLQGHPLYRPRGVEPVSRTMKPRPGRLRRALLTLTPVALFLGGFGWLTYVRFQRAHLNYALLSAVTNNDDRSVASLLAEGADPDAQDVTFWQWILYGLRGKSVPLTSAPRALVIALDDVPPSPQNMSIIRALVDAGASIHFRYLDGDTPLMRAIWAQKHEAVRLLLRKGADVNGRNDYGATPLMKAAAFADPEMIDLLLENGAELNARDNYGCTAYRFAILYGEAKNVQALIDRHADF